MLTEKLERRKLNAGITSRQGVGANEHDGSRRFHIEWIANPNRMTQGECCAEAAQPALGNHSVLGKRQTQS
jgi:hypothetical protein